jgi:hypothetical protein
MLKIHMRQNEKDWDVNVPYVLFAIRDSVQESLGFSPFELVFGHEVRGPLRVVKEKFLDSPPSTDLLSYVTNMRDRLAQACKIASENMSESQARMKVWYDKDAKTRSFQIGDQALILLPVIGSPLQAQFSGPYEVLKKVGHVNYVLSTPDRRKKTQLCHVNMMKRYFPRVETEKATVVVAQIQQSDQINDDEVASDFSVPEVPMKLSNSDILQNLDTKLGHLETSKKTELKALIQEFPPLFPDTPGKAVDVTHDVDVQGADPIKQHPYRVGPLKQEAMKKEIEYMKKNGIIEDSQSNWSSPCILTPKPDGSYRFVTDFRKVNGVTKADNYPIPRVDDCIDQIGSAKFVTKFDLLKGYWQIPLTQRAREVSAFVTPFGFYQYRVTAFGMRNSGSTFQRFMNKVISGLKKTKVYIDDIIIYSDTWEEHMKAIRALFQRLMQYSLTVNLAKCDFAFATVKFLGHVVGQGQVLPVNAKVQTISEFATPQNKKSLMRFLGMIGFYRRFCKNFSDVAMPLTELLKKDVQFNWTEVHQRVFEQLKELLVHSPVLVSPNFATPFRLYCDASDVGVGAMLAQVDSSGVEHPVSFFSRKLNAAQKGYATVEKEALALLLALKHYDVYLNETPHTIEVFTDHNPLTFVHRMKLENQRLLRWSLTLQEWTKIVINHVKGTDNVVADALSRA